ncbi:uncharacterized protein METZ01_LOCUS171108, partial [marine metagenome]
MPQIYDQFYISYLVSFEQKLIFYLL